jgi:endonuclease/exonuclease/phosphatase family metal-dependent hydrolase
VSARAQEGRASEEALGGLTRVDAAARFPTLRNTVTSFLLKTWNCFGAAQNAQSFLRWRGVPDAHRLLHPHLVSTVKTADVVCVQELFLHDAVSFFDGLDHEHKARDHNANTYWPLTFGGSGLGVASRMPLVSQRVHVFGGPKRGSERFARKGMLHARLRVAGVELDVVTTHLQSGYDARSRAVRAHQLAELRALVDTVGSDERTFVICGDLNIDGLAPVRGGEYAAIRAALPGFDDLGAERDLPTFHPDAAINALAHRYEAGSPAQRIDYVLFRPSRRRDVEPDDCELFLHEPLPCEPLTFASDHFGLRVRLHVKS